MKEFFKDIFEYHHHFNQKLIEQLIENENLLPKRTIPLFSHLINAQQIWNARITNKETLGVHQSHTLPECKQIDNDNYMETLYILNAHELHEHIAYKTQKALNLKILFNKYFSIFPIISVTIRDRSYQI